MSRHRNYFQKIILKVHIQMDKGICVIGLQGKALLRFYKQRAVFFVSIGQQRTLFGA